MGGQPGGAAWLHQRFEGQAACQHEALPNKLDLRQGRGGRKSLVCAGVAGEKHTGCHSFADNARSPALRARQKSSGASS